MFDWDKAREKIRESLEKLTPEEIENYFPADTKPKGWLSIEEYLPMFMAVDFANGCSVYKVRYENGTVSESGVADHDVWYYYAKNEGITHWFNE
jgi:hypothetical protein